MSCQGPHVGFPTLRIRFGFSLQLHESFLGPSWPVWANFDTQMCKASWDWLLQPTSQASYANPRESTGGLLFFKKLIFLCLPGVCLAMRGHGSHSSATSHLPSMASHGCANSFEGAGRPSCSKKYSSCALPWVGVACLACGL